MSSRVNVGANQHLAERILTSPYYMRHCAESDMLAVAELAIDSDFVGGLYGGAAGRDRASPFACLALRVLVLAHGGNAAVAAQALEFVEEFVSQPHHKYLRVFGILCTRLLCSSGASASALRGVPVTRVHKALDTGFLDYRRVRVIAADGTVSVSTVDQVCDQLLFGGLAFFGLALPPMPSRRQMLELHPAEAKSLLLSDN